MRWSPTALSLVLLALLLGQSASLAAEPAEEPPTDLVSPWPMEAIGSLTLETHSGAVVSKDDAALTSTRLIAEELMFSVQWLRGYQVHSGEARVVGIDREWGEYSLQAHDAELRFGDWPGIPTLFVTDDQEPVDVRMDTQDGFEFLPEYDKYAIGLGQSPNTTSLTGQRPPIGYWHLQEGPFTRATGTSNLHVEGDFTLVVENAEIFVEEPDDEWTHWTGYWESDPESPFIEYEFRITEIEVKNGTLVSPHRSSFSLYAQQIEAGIDGILSSPGVTGRLLQKSKAFIFDEDPMELRGSGELQLEATTARQSTLTELHLKPTGEYDVRGASNVEILEEEEPDDDWPGTLLSWLIGGLAAAAMTTVGLARLGYLPPTTPAAKHRRYEAWIRRGQEAADRRRWPQASWCFRKATRVKGDEPVAWFEWAHSELEAGNHAKADEVAQRASRVPGIDPMDILDLRASAAWERGDQKALEVHLTELAKGDLTIAQGLVHDLEIDITGLSPGLRKLLGTPETTEEEGIDGYA